MPYSNVKDLPVSVKKYSFTLQRMFLYTFNNTYNKLIKEGKDPKEADSRAFSAAYSTINKRVEKHSSARYGHDNCLFIAVDKFLGNVKKPSVELKW